MDDGISILREFRQNKYFINKKAIRNECLLRVIHVGTFIEVGSNLDLLKTVNGTILVYLVYLIPSNL